MEWYQFEWPRVTSNPDFKVMISFNVKWLKNGTRQSYTYNGWPIESRIWSIYWRHFQWPWTTPIPSFKVTQFFDAEYLRNGTTYRHSFNEILIGTYIRPTKQCHFEWPWMTSKIFNDTKRRAVSLRQLSFLCFVHLVCHGGARCNDRRYDTIVCI